MALYIEKNNEGLILPDRKLVVPEFIQFIQRGRRRLALAATPALLLVAAGCVDGLPLIGNQPASKGVDRTAVETLAKLPQAPALTEAPVMPTPTRTPVPSPTSTGPERGGGVSTPVARIEGHQVAPLATAIAANTEAIREQGKVIARQTEVLEGLVERILNQPVAQPGGENTSVVPAGTVEPYEVSAVQVAAAGAGISSQPVEQVQGQQAGPVIPRPVSFRPEDPGGMQNVMLPFDAKAEPNVPKGGWFHPMTRVKFLGNRVHVASYQYYFADLTDMDLVTHAGEEGRLVFRQEMGPSRFVLGVGVLDEFVDIRGVRKDLRGDIRTGFRPEHVPSIWIRTHPDVQMSVFDPDTGQPLMLDGRPVSGVTSKSGDIGFGLGDCGRIVLVAIIPVDPKLETFVWKGVHNRVQDDVNWIDLRLALQCVRAEK